MLVLNFTSAVMSQSIFLKERKLLQSLFLDETTLSQNTPFSELFLQIWSNNQSTFEIILHDPERKSVVNSSKNFRVFKTASMALRFWKQVIDYWLSFEPFHLTETRMTIYLNRAYLYSPSKHEVARFEIIPNRIKIPTSKNQEPSGYGQDYDEMLAWLSLFHLENSSVDVTRLVLKDMP